MIAQPTSTQDSEELARFRESWKEEVKKRRKAAESAHVGREQELDGSAAEQPNQHFIFHTPLSKRPEQANGAHTSHVGPSRFVNILVNSPAVATYRDAVKHEQQGDYERAIHLYKKAFNQDPGVDRAYLIAEEAAQSAALSTGSDLAASQATEQLAKEVAKMTIHDAPHSESAVVDSFNSIISAFPQDLRFEPEDEKQGQPLLNAIPEELLLHILKTVDTTTLERFAVVCRKARVLTLDSTLWQELVLRTYRPPQISGDVTLANLLLTNFVGDWRRMYIEQPRVRMDGVYIAVCHYVRAGLSENSWVNINHVITYHRYLRFYPNGQVLSLLANEEFNPQQVIPLLKPTLRMKGFYIGEWYLKDTTVYINNLFDASGQYHVPGSDILPVESTHGHHRHTSTQPQPMKYVFQMRLGLSSKPIVGRWNRLKLTEYESVDVNSGEACPMSTRHDRPFLFSKVRSYAPFM